MGNYFSAWDTMLDRWNTVWNSTVVLTTENPDLTWNYQMNKHDGAGLSWDVNRLSTLNELEFCSMIGHDADLRIFFYPIIEERHSVIIDTFTRSEFDWDGYDDADFLLWNEKDIFDMWEIWRMCHDQAWTFAASRAEIANNFGMAGNNDDMQTFLELLTPTSQKELVNCTDFKYEAIGFREFATRMYAVMQGEEENPTRRFLVELMLDIRMRRYAIPYRCKAVFNMF